MKILQIVTKRQFRGAEVFAATLSEDLTRNNHQVWFWGIYRPPAIALSPLTNRVGDLLSNRYISRVRELSGIISEFNPDVIQANGSVTLQYALIARWFSNSQAKVVYRNISIISVWMRNPLKKLIYKKLFSRIDKVISVSDESRLDFMKTLSYPSEKIVTIKRGIDIVEQPELVSAPDKIDARYLLHVGSFTPEKNHTSLLRIFERVVSECPAVNLICLGEGPLKSDFEQQVKARNLETKIRIAGFQKDTISYYRNASVFVLTSTIEGIPGVIMEAAAQVVPSVAFHVGGIGEVVTNGQTGFLISPGDERDFAAKILMLLRDETLRTTMGRNAFEFVKLNHDRNNTVHKFIQLYQSVIPPNVVNSI